MSLSHVPLSSSAQQRLKAVGVGPGAELSQPCPPLPCRLKVLLEGPSVLAASVSDKGDGTYAVSYTATAAGVYQLSITIGEWHGLSCPLLLVAVGVRGEWRCVRGGMLSVVQLSDVLLFTHSIEAALAGRGIGSAEAARAQHPSSRPLDRIQAKSAAGKQAGRCKLLPLLKPSRHHLQAPMRPWPTPHTPSACCPGRPAPANAR